MSTPIVIVDAVAKGYDDTKANLHHHRLIILNSGALEIWLIKSDCSPSGVTARISARHESARPADQRSLAGMWLIEKRDRNWIMIDPDGFLDCITVYKKGAQEVVRRLAA